MTVACKLVPSPGVQLDSNTCGCAPAMSLTGRAFEHELGLTQASRLPPRGNPLMSRALGGQSSTAKDHAVISAAFCIGGMLMQTNHELSIICASPSYPIVTASISRICRTSGPRVRHMVRYASKKASGDGRYNVRFAGGSRTGLNSWVGEGFWMPAM